jgi:hypothetical protein
MDVRLIYGRQISFAPSKAKVPELEQLAEAAPELAAKSSGAPASPAPAKKTIAPKPKTPPRKK